jgi:hypothetical protein
MKSPRTINHPHKFLQDIFSKRSAMNESPEQIKELHAKINGETSLMPWKELLRHFASGIVIEAGEQLDLIDVAIAVTCDDTVSVKKWMFNNQLTKVSDARAETWLVQDTNLWTVVVKPWILVQEKRAPKKDQA